MSDFPDKKTSGDYAILALKASVSAIPVVGGPAAELIGLINTPLEIRKVQWLNDIAERVKSLEESGSLSLLDLKDNQEFITIFTHASQIAIRNHEQEKLDALRNAVINTAKRTDVGENVRLMFLSYVDSITPWHLHILQFFQNPKGLCSQRGVNTSNYYMGGPSQPLEQCFPELRGRRELYDLIYADLGSKGLVSEGTLHATMTATGMLQKRTTVMGDNFLRFISE